MARLLRLERWFVHELILRLAPRRDRRTADLRRNGPASASGNRRWSFRMVVSGVFVIAALPACGTGGDRPTDAQWRATWEQDRLLMPDVDTLLTGGTDLCGDLIGRFRVSLPDLTPTPTEALDGAVDAWVAHAESVVFDCPDDRAELVARIEVLDVLAAEIDAGLTADER